MCLTCKLGTYNSILKELLDLKVPRNNIFLLFGTFDILVQFPGLKSLDEFKERWFNPVRLIGDNRDLITRTQTFIVISEGPLHSEEPFAFMFLNAQPRNLDKVSKALIAISEVLSADTVFGPYDVICSVKAENRVDLERIVSKILKDVSNIEGTMVAIVTTESMFFI